MDWTEINFTRPGLEVQSLLVLVQSSPGLFAVFRTGPEGTKCNDLGGHLGIGMARHESHDPGKSRVE